MSSDLVMVAILAIYVLGAAITTGIFAATWGGSGDWLPVVLFWPALWVLAPFTLIGWLAYKATQRVKALVQS